MSSFWDLMCITLLQDFLLSYCLWPEPCPVCSVFAYVLTLPGRCGPNIVERLGVKFTELFIPSVNCSRFGMFKVWGSTVVHFNFLSLPAYCPRCLLTEDQWLTSVHLLNASKVLRSRHNSSPPVTYNLQAPFFNLPRHYKFIPVLVRDSMSSEHIRKRVHSQIIEITNTFITVAEKLIRSKL